MASTDDTLRVVIAGGGTGGHIFPGIAVADELKRIDSSTTIQFVGSESGLEAQVVPQHGYPFATISSGKLHGVSLFGRLSTVVRLPKAVWQARELLKTVQAQIVVGVGGYASAATVAAAAVLRLPVILLEQNAVVGTTNKQLSRFARYVVVAFASALEDLPADKGKLLGNPLRPRLREALRNPPDVCKNRVLVLGGSQGAHRINQLMLDVAPKLRARVPDLSIEHQTGKKDFATVKESYQRQGIDAKVSPFIEDVERAYLTADFAVARSGATTVAELTACGLPALFVPYPFAVDDHQAKNVQHLVRIGAALMERQSKLTADKIADLVGDALNDRERLNEMRLSLRSYSRVNAASAVAKLIRDQARITR